jgi:hypothetical protein
VRLGRSGRPETEGLQIHQCSLITNLLATGGEYVTSQVDMVGVMMESRRECGDRERLPYPVRI